MEGGAIMLTASKILKEMDKGNIEIDPFNIDNLNPNSYNITLRNILKVYDKSCVLQTDKENPVRTIEIPKNGIILEPGTLYIGATNERIFSDKFIPAIDGRSSIGRLGINIHATAGFGDIGFNGTFTLEIFVLQRVLVKPDILIGQVYFEEPCGDIDFLYNGRYQNQIDPTESRLHMVESQLNEGYHYKNK
jgi:dCTP deaminase